MNVGKVAVHYRNCLYFLSIVLFTYNKNRLSQKMSYHRVIAVVIIITHIREVQYMKMNLLHCCDAHAQESKRERARAGGGG